MFIFFLRFITGLLIRKVNPNVGGGSPIVKPLIDFIFNLLERGCEVHNP